MAMITAVVDVQDANGDSVVVANPDGTRSPLVLKLAAGLTATFVKSGDQGIVTVAPDGSAASTVSSLTITGQSLPFIGPRYQVPTTDATPQPVATFPVGIAGTLGAEVRCIPTLGTGPNANGAPCDYRFCVIGARKGSDAPDPEIDDDRSSVSAPFTAAQRNGSRHGAPNVTVSGNSVVFQVIGFAIKEAWTSGHAYVTGDGSTIPGDFVTSSGGVWVCVSSGTASGSAPTGTGRAQGTGATFDYVGPASGSQVPVTWTLMITGLVTGP